LADEALTYSVYILRCSDDTLYTGIAKDVHRRLDEHNNSAKGAKYTKSRRPVTLVYAEACMDRSAASKREYQIKRLSKDKKSDLISQYSSS